MSHAGRPDAQSLAVLAASATRATFQRDGARLATIEGSTEIAAMLATLGCSYRPAIASGDKSVLFALEIEAPAGARRLLWINDNLVAWSLDDPMGFTEVSPRRLYDFLKARGLASQLGMLEAAAQRVEAALEASRRAHANRPDPRVVAWERWLALMSPALKDAFLASYQARGAMFELGRDDVRGLLEGRAGAQATTQSSMFAETRELSRRLVDRVGREPAILELLTLHGSFREHYGFERVADAALLLVPLNELVAALVNAAPRGVGLGPALKSGATQHLRDWLETRRAWFGESLQAPWTEEALTAAGMIDSLIPPRF